MSPVVLVGPCAGLGLVLVMRGLVPRPAALAGSLRRLDRIGVS